MAIKLVEQQFLEYVEEEFLPGGYVGYAVPSRDCKNLCVIKFKTGKFFWEGEYPYDEIMYVIDGPVKMRTEGKTYVAQSGDILFVNKGTTASYEAEISSNVFSVTFNPPLDVLVRKIER